MNRSLYSSHYAPDLPDPVGHIVGHSLDVDDARIKRACFISGAGPIPKYIHRPLEPAKLPKATAAVTGEKVNCSECGQPFTTDVRRKVACDQRCTLQRKNRMRNERSKRVAAEQKAARLAARVS